MFKLSDTGISEPGIVSMEEFNENFLSCKYIKCYKIPLRLNHYNFWKVIAIDCVFSTLHTTPFHYGNIHFGLLH